MKRVRCTSGSRPPAIPENNISTVICLSAIVTIPTSMPGVPVCQVIAPLYDSHTTYTVDASSNAHESSATI